MHTLNQFARCVEASGRKANQKARAKRFTQGLTSIAFLWLLVACQSAFAPIPFKIWQTQDPNIIWLDPKDPNSMSLRNSDPKTFRYRSTIDLSLKPDIL